MKIAFEEHGAGLPLVLLHAFPLSRKMWSPQIQAFTQAGFRLILPDLRGFGETSSFADINSIEDMANDVAELLDLLQVEKTIIGGLSMGGYTAFSLFRLHPTIFKALILCDTNCAADSEEKRKNRFGMIESIETNGSQALIDKMLPNLVGEFTKENDKNLMTELGRMFLETNSQSAIAALRGMAERADYCHLLPEINVPTLLIFGAEDAVTTVEDAENMRREIKNSRLYTIEKAGHYSNLEQPEEFNRAVISFIKELQL